jgi:hypothetical protein
MIDPQVIIHIVVTVMAVTAMKLPEMSHVFTANSFRHILVGSGQTGQPMLFPGKYPHIGRPI